MSDYIKREDAINVFDWGMPDADVKCGIAIQNIKDIPSSDVVEVVRCKDCKWRDTIPRFNVFLSNGCRWHEAESPDDDDYCSFGERADT